MTTRIPLLLAALLATQVAPAQAKPQAAPIKTSASDQARVDGAMSQAVASYRRLRSYSGRFASGDPLYGQSQTGTLQFERPNRVAMRVQVKEREGSHTRRVVSDGQFVWTLDSRFKNRYTKEKVRRGENYLGIIVGYGGGTGGWMDLAWFLKSETPMDGISLWRVTSPPNAPVLALDAFTVAFGAAAPEEGSSPRKMTFRFGPDNLLRASTEKLNFGEGDKFERHWDIRLNPKLPASIFTFKPAPGARQIKDFDPFALPEKLA